MLLPLEVFHDWSSACCKTSIPYMQMVGCGQARTGQIDGGQDGGYPPCRAGASLTICQCHDYPSAIYYYVTPAAGCSSPVSTQKAAPVEEEKKWKAVWRIKLPQVFISEVLQWLLCLDHNILLIFSRRDRGQQSWWSAISRSSSLLPLDLAFLCFATLGKSPLHLSILPCSMITL
jgi:hypothetical protein